MAATMTEKQGELAEILMGMEPGDFVSIGIDPSKVADVECKHADGVETWVVNDRRLGFFQAYEALCAYI